MLKIEDKQDINRIFKIIKSDDIEDVTSLEQESFLRKAWASYKAGEQVEADDAIVLSVMESILESDDYDSKLIGLVLNLSVGQKRYNELKIYTDEQHTSIRSMYKWILLHLEDKLCHLKALTDVLFGRSDEPTLKNLVVVFKNNLQFVSVLLDEDAVDKESILHDNLEEFLSLKNWKQILNAFLFELQSSKEVTFEIPSVNISVEEEVEKVDDATVELQRPVQPIDIPTVTAILKERYRYNKRHEEMKDGMDGWKKGALQYAKDLENWFLKHPEFGDFTKVEDTVEILRTESLKGQTEWNVNSCTKYISALNTLIELLTEDEKLQYFGSMKRFSESLDCIKKAQAELKKHREDLREYQEFTDDEKAVVDGLTWSKLEKIVEEHLRKQRPPEVIETELQYVFVRRLAIISLLMDHPPRRLEVLNVRLDSEGCRNDKGANYYEDGKIVLNDYKISDRYKQYVIGISERTSHYFELLKAYSKSLDRNYIFGTDRQVKTDGFTSKLMKNAFSLTCGKELTCNILRKLYVQEMESQGKLRWEIERKELARKMGHSVALQQGTYLKRNSKVEDDDKEEKEEDFHDDENEVVESQTDSSDEEQDIEEDNGSKENERVAVAQQRKRVRPTPAQSKLLESLINGFHQEVMSKEKDGKRIMYPWKKWYLEYETFNENLSTWKTLPNWGKRYIRGRAYIKEEQVPN